jgi:sortase A
MKRAYWLKWLERLLLAVGATLAVWCALVLVEAYRTQSMPVPPPIAMGRDVLPGENEPAPSPAPSPAPTPSRGAWVARLEAPTLKMAATVLEGSDDRTLARGAGHIEETPFPGQPGNVGIAGHRDTIFRALRNAQVGTPLTLVTRDREYRYEISRTLIVQPGDVYVLDPTPEPTLTLVTCYPFEFIGHAPKRFIVQAKLVGEDVRRVAAGH